MKKLKNIILGFVVMACLSATAQFRGPKQPELAGIFEGERVGNIQINEMDSLITWQERVLLHLDKTTIDQNSPLFFKGYVLTGPKRVRATLSEVLKVDLVRKEDSSVVGSQYYKIENGTTEGAIHLPPKTETGSYELRAYTRWMQNYGEGAYFTKELNIVDGRKRNRSGEEGTSASQNDRDFKVHFYPEGGRLIAGLENRLLIKATGENGKPGVFEGKVVDGSGKQISPVVVFDNGIMTANFKPDPREHYMLETSDGMTYDIPEVVDEGYVLNINNLDPTTLKIRIQATPEMISKEVRLKGEMNGITYFEKELDLEAPDVTLEIPRRGIPFGIMSVSLVDAEASVWSRRPVFMDPNNTLNIAFTPLNEGAQAEERAYKVRVTNTAGSPVQTTLALSATHVAGEEGIVREAPDVDFLWELHGADLSGWSTVRTDRFIKDLELLTSGAGEEGMGPRIPETIVYPFQRGLDLIGYAYDLNNRLLRDATIQLLIQTDEDAIIKELQTDSSGRLEVNNLQLTGETELIFRTEGEDTSTRLVKVIPVQEDYDENLKRKAVLAFAKQQNRETIESSPLEPLDSEGLIELNSVEVFDQKIERPRAMPPTYGLEATKFRTVVQDIEKPRFMFQLFAEIPGITVTGGSADAPSITVNSSNWNASGAPNSFGSVLDQSGPLWVIDGFIWGNSPGVDPTMGLDAWSIDRIEYLRPAEGGIYGSRAGGGVIMVYTRNGSDLEFINRKEGRLYFQGYNETPDFESYSAMVAKKAKKFIDKPTTVYWNPQIETDENGEAIVRFKLPFETQKLKIKASAITAQGEIASSQQYLE